MAQPGTSSIPSQTAGQEGEQTNENRELLKPRKYSRVTNQLIYLEKTILKEVWKHAYGWPFHKPVDAKKLKLPVSAIFFPPDLSISRGLSFLLHEWVLQYQHQ